MVKRLLIMFWLCSVYSCFGSLVDKCLSCVEKRDELLELDTFFSSVEKGDYPSVERSLDLGVDVNSKDARGRTALQIAVNIYFRHNLRIIELLLNKGANVNIQDKEGVTALMLAADQSGGEFLVELFLDRGACVDMKDKNAFTALMYAAMVGCKNSIKILIRSGAKIPFSNHAGKYCHEILPGSDICPKMNYYGMIIRIWHRSSAESLLLYYLKKTSLNVNLARRDIPKKKPKLDEYMPKPIEDCPVETFEEVSDYLQELASQRDAYYRACKNYWQDQLQKIYDFSDENVYGFSDPSKLINFFIRIQKKYEKENTAPLEIVYDSFKEPESLYAAIYFVKDSAWFWQKCSLDRLLSSIKTLEQYRQNEVREFRCDRE